jgi:hypothetical protein
MISEPRSSCAVFPFAEAKQAMAYLEADQAKGNERDRN